MKENLINLYPLSKTLRFSLIPVGDTEVQFNKKLLLESDEKRAEDYKKVKQYMDEYHKFYIESILKDFILDGIDDYACLYSKLNKTDEDKENMKSMEDAMRKSISKALTGDKRYGKLQKKEFIKELLPEFLSDDEQIATVKSFENFSTYFTGFFTNRNNLYSSEEKSTAIAYRCINDNLPKFIDNVRSFEKVKNALPKENFETLNQNFDCIYGVEVQDVFNIDYFSFVLAQSGIEKYNNLLGGYTNSDGSKVQGLNEYINLYNQKLSKEYKKNKLPLLKPLYKQILSDKESISFIPEQFESDNELLAAINESYVDEKIGVKLYIDKLCELISNLNDFNTDGIFISSGQNITNISNKVFGDWSVITANWKREYEANHPIGKNADKYHEKENNTFKNIKSFSISELQRLGGEHNSIIEYFCISVKEQKTIIEKNYTAAKELLTQKYENKKRLSQNDNAIEQIKSFLDSIKDFEKFAKMLIGTGKEENKDNVFYGEFLPLFDKIKVIDNLYDKVRNYLTKKPYSKDKIKLNFNNSSFLNGWASDYETKGAIIITRGNNYYLAIVDKKLNKDSIDYLLSHSKNDLAYRIIYDFQKPDNKNVPRLFIRSKKDRFAPAVQKYNLPIEDVLDIYDNELFKTSYKKIDCKKQKESLGSLIDYFKKGFLCHESYSQYEYSWKDSSEYNDISEFYHDVQISCYQLRKEKINFSNLLDLVDKGELYLFQIYNKDFSEYSKGKNNLHTLYFKMLFDERNLKNVVYKLSGGAEMFYRKPSINKEEQVIHPANQPINNKNENNPKKQSVFDYDLIKDRRFTKRQFMLHIPIEMNYKSDGRYDLNSEVRNSLKESKEQYIIGIDRGERNLIYASVINQKGEIVEQQSFNIIRSDNDYMVDYHSLLEKREKERDASKKSWKTVGNIKELKEGYISQVVHKICELVVKYDAIIAMEDLNSGFINSRKKVDKQVYQKFENMLITKLNYLVDKTLDANENGGLLKAYQLTNKLSPQNNKAKQNGIVFYVPAWLTSKIDPTTGFVNLINPKYKNVSASVELIDQFDDIRFNEQENLFEFELDYSKFYRGSVDYKQKWTICTYGDRIKTFRNKAKNSEWDNEVINLTNAFKELFDEYNIDYNNDLKAQILSQSSAKFHEKFIKLLSLTLQMRNSITNNVNVDYLISPVRNSTGNFYDSRNYNVNSTVPCDADANGAYNIARKALWAVEQIKHSEDVKKAKLSISKKEWLEFAQTL